VSGGLTNVQKAAVLLLQLGHESAARVLAEMPESQVEEVTAEIVRMESVRPELSAEVMREFHDRAFGGSAPVGVGGLEVARRLLEESLGADRAEEFMDRLSVLLAGQPFDFLQKADGAQVQSLISGEHPQTVALVLAHLRADRASAIMKNLAPGLRADVALRIATMDQSSPEVVSLVADNLQRRATMMLTSGEYASVGGIQPLVEILNRSDPGTEKQVLEELEERDTELAEVVRSQLFTFDDILLLEDLAVQLVMRSVDNRVLATALKGSFPEVRRKIESNLSERRREDLHEEEQAEGPVRMSQVQEARGTIVTVIRTLEESGQIVIHREGEDEYVE
jgi:flagellar motor switch protein FliG